MIDKIIRIKDGRSYYVIDAYKKNDRMFIFGIEALEQNDLLTNLCTIFEAKVEDGKVTLHDIDDQELDEVNKVFIERFKSSKGISV